jgi:hypothetical protein
LGCFVEADVLVKSAVSIFRAENVFNPEDEDRASLNRWFLPTNPHGGLYPKERER